MTACAIDWCDRPTLARGWCAMHYQRWKKGTDMDARLDDPVWRFWRKVDKAEGDGCWEWTGYVAKHGYGRVVRNGVELYAHRVAYELEVGPIPEDLVIDHLCRNTVCVRPSHLQAVPQAVNLLRGESPFAKNARKTHCKRGHLLDGGNVTYRKEGRVCAVCRRERDRLAYAEKKGQLGAVNSSDSTSLRTTVHAPQATSPAIAAVTTSPPSSVTTAVSPATSKTPQATIPTEPLMNVTKETVHRG